MRPFHWRLSINLLAAVTVCCCFSLSYLEPLITVADSIESINSQGENRAVLTRTPSRHWTPASEFLGETLVRRKRQYDVDSCPTKLPNPRRVRSRASITFYHQKKHRDFTIYPGKDKLWRKDDIKFLIGNGLDLKKTMIIYSHGYLQTYKSVWLMMLRKRFSDSKLSAEKRVNLLIFDWGDFGTRVYPSAASFAPHLGKLLGDFLIHLRTHYDYSMDKVHLVGYSLSTHIIGIAARQLASQGKVGQITAIDPTGVCFHQKDEFAKKYQLLPSDAKFVVAKAYDFGELGPHKLIGGVDILVNGGARQPFMALQTNGIRSLLSHVRATDHEVDLFDEDCQDVAYACSSYKAFLSGECGECGKSGEKCFQMNTIGNIKLGLETNKYKPNTVMYITTGRARFCIHHYQVIAKLKSNSTKSIQNAFEAGGLTISFSNGVGRISPSHRVDSNKFTTLMRAPQKILAFHDKLDVAVRAPDKTLEDMVETIEYLNVNYMSNISPKERAQASAKYSPSGGSLIKNRSV